MVKPVYMLDTCICSFIMRKQPPSILAHLQKASSKGRIVVSAITYAEMQYGVIGKKASPKHALMVEAFLACLDEVLPWDKHAVDKTVVIKQQLAAAGTPIGANDTAIAGHAMASNCILVTNNTREFARVDNLLWEDWG